MIVRLEMMKLLICVHSNKVSFFGRFALFSHGCHIIMDCFVCVYPYKHTCIHIQIIVIYSYGIVASGNRKKWDVFANSSLSAIREQFNAEITVQSYIFYNTVHIFGETWLSDLHCTICFTDLFADFAYA